MKTLFAITLLAACLGAGSLPTGSARADEGLKSLTICADPGNMPLSNEKGEGFQNKIAQVLGQELGHGVSYYWRPSIERGLMRTTLAEGNCDVWMDMAADTEGAITTLPLYRSTFVFAYRSDKGLGTFKTLNDPRLQKLRIGLFQVSAIRQALAEHGVMSNTVIHYLSHNGDLIAENQPSYQVQQVIDGKLDIAAAWGPMAGYYKTMKHAPLIIQPVNTIDDTVPLEFDMALAVPRGRPEIKAAVERALSTRKNDIRRILDDFGVPLVKCDGCIISGNLPSHGPYKALPVPQFAEKRDGKSAEASVTQLKQWLADGAKPDDELGNAIVGADVKRVAYLLDHGANPNARFGDGYTALGNATRFGFDEVATYLADHKADANMADQSRWTPLMYAAWADDAQAVRMLVAHGAKQGASEDEGLTAVAVATQNGKFKALAALIETGADVNQPIGKGGYTPLMLASMSGSIETVDLLIKHGAKVNAKNPGGVTALMIVAASNQSKVGSRLIEAGADLDARSEDGRTALTIAQANNSEAVLKLLKEAAEHGTTKSG
jgi:quinoprotein dehydrogenase-associated probable ABC transporter substrate-binding protein